MRQSVSTPDQPAGERRTLRQSKSYRLALLCLLVALLAATVYLLRVPVPRTHYDAVGAGGSSSSATPLQAIPAQPPTPSDTQGGVVALPEGAAGAGSEGWRGGAAATQSDAEQQGRAQIQALRERLQQLTGEPPRPEAGGPEALAEGASADGAGAPAPGDAAAAGSVGEPDVGYRVDLPPYDREAFAERQRQLEALRAETLAALHTVSPADAEGMLGVIKRMSEGIRAQGLPDIIDMPKMEAMLLGTKRINELNAALVAEMGKGAASRPEEMARLAGEIQAVQATIPSTVYDLEVVGKLMRGELP
ncbi:hypothetical protein [Thauera mechernichensis]